MKKFISLVAMLSFVSGVAFAYDADGNQNTKREMAGSPAWVPYREYQLVRFGENAPNSTALSQGDVVLNDCVSDDGVSVGIVGAANSVDAVAGVVVSVTIPTADTVGTTAQTDYGRRNWGYIQKKGLCTKVNVIAGGAAGTALVASDSLRCATAGTPGKAGYRALGFAYDASGAGNANDVYIDL